MTWEPTNELRFVKREMDMGVKTGTVRVLQQKWVWVTGSAHPVGTKEWHDVPLCEEDDE